jgi:sugar lactone lactonase YvrE
VDADSNVYIADRGHHRIRKLTKTGTEYIITTIAGTGEEGDEDGDGGPATAAQLNGPRGVTVGDDDYIYIADTGNNRIHQIGPDGVITTIAGAEDGGDGPAMSPQLSVPRGVAVDAGGNLYIADTGNNQIHKLDDEGIVTVAGAGGLGDEGPATNARLLEPTGLAIDVDGTIYITDSGNNRVRKVDVEGTITTLAGTGEEGDGGDGGPATEAQLYYPIGVAIDSEGNVYISDTFNNRIRKVDSEGIITTFAGTGDRGRFEADEIGDGGPATEGKLRGPTGLAFDAEGSLYITDFGNSRIRKVDTEVIITTFAGTGERSFSGDDGPAGVAQFSSPLGFEIDGDGNFYLTDRYYDRNRIRKIDTEGIVTTIAETASSGGVTVGTDASVYITEISAGRVLKLSPSGKLSIIAGSARSGFSGDGGPATEAQLDEPRGIEIDADGNVYVVDSNNGRVRKLTPNRRAN